MVKRLRRRIAVASEPVPGPNAVSCVSPELQLFLRATGEVRTCCVNERPLGWIPTDRLTEIWDGARRAELVHAMTVDDLSLGCGTCATEIETEGRPGSFAAKFDWLAEGQAPTPRWPKLLTFNLSIDCNLQCVQCDGDLSSSIRIHREHRPPLAGAYDDQFFEDVQPFLANAQLAIFSGGEPFLARENYRIWSMVPTVAPHLECRVITNATQWNPRVQQVLDDIPMGFVFSLDGITKATYESIRIGADFEHVMANLERFRTYASDRGTWASVNHCLMPSNVHEFGDLLLWAEERELRVEVCVVRKPSAHSIAELPQDQLEHVVAALQRQADEVLPHLQLNRETWLVEVARIEAWAEAGTEGRRHLSGLTGDTVGNLPRAGTRPYDDHEVRAELVHDGIDADEIHHFDMDCDDRIVDCSENLAAVGLTSSEVLGTRTDQLLGRFQAAFGPLRKQSSPHESPDRIDHVLDFRDARVRASTVALRNAEGLADLARIVVGVFPPEP